MAKKSKALQRPVTPPEDLFSAPSASEEEPERAEADNEPEGEKPRSRRRAAKKQPEQDEVKREKTIQVSIYMPESWLNRLDLLKNRERSRLKAENKRATRSTIIREAIRDYLERKEK